MPVAPTTEPEPTAPATSAAPVAPARSLWRTILTPRWLGLLALALAIAAVMSVLGVWQLDVYHSKTAAKTAERTAAAPVSLQSLFSIDAGLPSKAVGRRITVTGTWAAASDQLYISHRPRNNQNGFWVVTPLLLDPTPGSSSTEAASSGATSSGAVMVVRGWVPTASEAAAKPPSGRVELTGTITASEAQDASGDATKGRILQSLRIPTIVHLVNYRVYDAFVVMSSATPAPTADAPAIVLAPSPPTDHAGLRNVAYAFQWWVFAAFTLWMYTRMLRDTHQTPTTT
ncbi:SURF1 family protein [Kribbella qitaiheensis]|uniref:SURF1-like protein n=1 Tax=Kribbella qitaiheensis TaxID=1544730 RepID=A0A7G6X0V0_9ACTN|nr:SURF1 family protein [Kribbella qitaiheensis]QNE19865.1 SURF1 family protein [Kribbella qitaiheensis]